MAKANGIIGNFNGKVGNVVGYRLAASANKQTQGVRIYQPVVKNPQTYAQAEQRVKYAPVNATYRLLKDIIDRGFESKTYGIRSRNAWLSRALKSTMIPYYLRGEVIQYPALVQLTDGTIPSIPVDTEENRKLAIVVNVATELISPTTAQVSNILLERYSFLKVGDQITFVKCQIENDFMTSKALSFIINPNDGAERLDDFVVTAGKLLCWVDDENYTAGTVIISRQGSNGRHLRSSSTLSQGRDYDHHYFSDSVKEAAIQSYMAQSSNTDWPEESVQ